MAATDAGDAVWRALLARLYTRKVIRDLVWAITSPHLIDAEQFPVLPVTFGVSGSDTNAETLVEWLTDLERDASHLIDFLRGKTSSKTRTSSRTKALALGVYFASLLEYWLRFCPLLRVSRFELSKQIISASNQTLGQLKFLFRVERGVSNDGLEASAFDDFHVESSVKFFLLHPLNEKFEQDLAPKTTYPLEQYVGPHLGENLAWRVQEVARKLDMCRGASVQTWLQDHYSDRVASHIVLRGYLFYPLRHFQSTSEVSRGHDWAFHRNPRSNGEPAPRHNPKVGVDHLCGWWTDDVETEFAQKVRANADHAFGESRFVVLPKLHWLSPILAEEDPRDGRVIVRGEDELQIEPLVTMDLEELTAFSREHFTELATSEETQAKGGVVMPLLVAEIVRCKREDREFDAASIRWRELSRGFLLDEKCWDPMPLVHDAVRYKRTNNEDIVVREREYEGRREWVTDGVIKPSDQEAELERLKKLHSFQDAETMTHDRMCEELLVVLEREQKKFTHSNLKQSVQSVLDHCDNEFHFVLRSVEYLVFKPQRELEDSASNSSSKAVQRVAHLLFDAIEDRSAASANEATLRDCTELFLKIAQDKIRWDCINVCLRGLDILQRRLQIRATGLQESCATIDETIKRLLSQRTPRWNAVAVEVVRVLYGDPFPAASPAPVQSSQREMLDELISQHDWKNAEQLVTACCHVDMELLVVLFKRFNALNTTKPIKRLRKLLVRIHADCAFDESDGSSHAVPKHSSAFQHALGTALDADANRAAVTDRIPEFSWTLVDTPDLIEGVVAQLQGCLEGTKTTIVGLDCEWRPQFLVKQDTASRETEDGDSTADEDPPVGEDEGVSVYQIAVNDHVYVVDVQLLGLAAEAPLRFIWNAPRGSFLLVGFCVSGDLRRLNHSFPSLLCHSENPRGHSARLLIELKQMALYRQLPAGPWGLSQLYEACFNEPIAKEEQCSDWGLRPLTKNQLAYAARDAYAVRNIALVLMADVAASENLDLVRHAERFAVITDLGMGSDLTSEADLGHWITTLTPMDESHVRTALVDLGLVATAESMFRIDKASWQDAARTERGLVVKTIAMVLKQGTLQLNGDRQDPNRRDGLHYVAVVLHVHESINMSALASHLSVAEDDLVLADRETLLRVFGYQRGSIGPIGLREQAAVHIVLDAALLHESSILPGAGHEDAMYPIDPRVLCEAVGASVAGLT